MTPLRVLVVDHYDSYTWNLVHLVASVTGVLPDVVEHDAPGHPSNAGDFALGTGVFELGVAVLGVCLGMQALVTSYGGTVDRVEPAHGEIALVKHERGGLFEGIPDPFQAVRYHSLAAIALPPVLRRTALDEHSGVTMAVAHRELPLVGVQFHPESILSHHGAELVRNFLS